MSAPARAATVALLVVLLLILPVVAATESTAGYTLTVGDTIDVPERTVTLEGDEYRIDRTAAVDVSNPIEVSVAAPDGERSYVYLYNADRDRMDVTTGFGSFEDSFDTAHLDPGTYLVAHYVDGNYEKLVPVVVNGYDIRTDHASEAAAGDELAVSATVTPTDSTGQPATVEVAVWNVDQQTRVELAHQGSGEYEGTVSLDGFESGEYNVHVAARSNEELRNGRNELLALRSSHSLLVEESSTDGTGSTGGSGAPPTADPTPDSTTATPPTSTPTTPTDTSTTSTTESPTRETPTATATPTEDSILTPNTGTETTAASTDSTARVPISPALAVVAFVLASLLLYRRH